MQVINNKIYIVQGETPTYTASIVDKDTGAPFMITKGMFANKGEDGDVRPIIEFVVRKSMYSRKEDIALKYNLILGRDITYHLFDDDVVVSYNALGHIPSVDSEGNYIWDNTKTPLSGNENRLHCYTDSNDDKFYIYYSGGAWHNYEFTFNVTFAYEHTSKLETKTYLYEIVLLIGVLKTNYEKWETIVEPFYKKPLLGLNDFIVGGSISE